MRIPEVRTQMLEVKRAVEALGLGCISETHWLELLTNWEAALHRRKYVRKAAPRRPTPDHEIIRLWAADHPEADYMQIAVACRTSTGRVSEALAGFRE